jgi:hypothetical protein
LKKERETQAACVLAVRMGNHSDNRNISRMRFILREDNALVETLEHMISRQFSTQCDHFSGEFIHQKSCFKLESLILAQNERWRQA